MKNKIILGIILIGIMFCVTGCSENSVANDDRMIQIERSSFYTIYYDKETKVEYIKGQNGHGGTSYTVLLNQDGTPLLYGG